MSEFNPHNLDELFKSLTPTEEDERQFAEEREVAARRPKPPTLKQLIKRHNIRIDVTYGIKTNWDKLDDWQREAHQYHVTLKRGRRRMTVDYYMGSRNTHEPTVDDVLDSILSDASGVEQSFEDWCSELGYDTDSRKAERIYKACLKIRRQLQQFLGDLYDTFMYADKD